MDRKVKSFRMRVDLLSWLEEYARMRGASQISVLEQAVVNFQRDARAGVPDLPVVDTPAVREQRVKAVRPQVEKQSVVRPKDVFADPNGTRQQRLNAQMLRARGKS